MSELQLKNSTSVDSETLTKARLSRDPRFDGTFFVAVKTTGIFCRPICPAKLPNEENVTYYQHATTAMAHGFRPCFRCRPDSAPHSPAWSGVGATVNRAIALLSVIPSESVSGVAARLGISERYLNKLMVNALGLSPKSFQNMHRALFAKQLIQQSSLSITDVAFTAGYQSLRQLQRAMAQYCDTTPSQLRKHQSHTEQQITLFLSYRPPYNWPYVRQFLAHRAIPRMERVTEDTYERWFEWEGADGYFSVKHDPKRSGFSVALTLSNLMHLHRVIENIKAMLDLNADPILIEESLTKAGLAPQQLTCGLRLPSAWSVFESGCRAIVGQQVSVKAAIGQVSLLVHHLGRQAIHLQDNLDAHDEKAPAQSHVYFPAPDNVASSDLGFLRMPQARKNAIRQFASLFAQSKMPSHDDILSIKGIGQWTLDYLKMRGERNPDVYLSGDLIVRKTAEKFVVRSEDAAPWRSYLTLQMWQLSEHNA
ncbi:3-methyladenine DNA glycosylase [Alteromonas sp. KC3]|jgi:AraC family transcriptional regulator of adaptative response / DNA-3-methyladenine glycosylase II|uniref:DNA-3-methyladenine glycosylase 2 family protein n=1 Tax=unclassified Alteromonas TaxID=2614992 RepID=UPI0019242C7D|nr:MULTISPECIES: AlkA N-terminal domain-containing protein [unclassified Alteromonas]BCO20894.1 3-methyladenine DNA glycosylase [Alteromonas sp. KC3]BCO24864.1 3-methyladenine DNA glycosylase [Alteromonas sp. KC14]